MTANKDRGVKGANTLAEAVDLISRQVNYLKKQSYLMAQDRFRSKIFGDNVRETLSPERQALWDKLNALRNELYGATKVTRGERVEKTTSSALDQAQIDAAILKFKENLTDGGKKLFDHLMLGSLDRTNLAKIDKFADSVKKWDKFTVKVVKELRAEGARTSLSRLGMSSRIPQESVQEHIGGYLSNFKEMWRRPTS